VHQDRLHLIVGGMAETEACGTFLSGNAAQKRVAGAAPGILDGEVMATGNLPDITPLGEEIEMEGPGQVAYPEGILRACLAAQSMVEMGDNELLGCELVLGVLQVQQEAEEAE
jgi:hypothetical protein